jgi:CBS domain-containing protein
MQDAVITCAPRTSALRIALLMTDRHIGSIPVVDEDRTLLGIISEADLLTQILQGKPLRDLTAADLMTKDVLSVPEDRTFIELATLFEDRGLIRVPVVRNGKLVGVVARRDLVFGHLNASIQPFPHP